MPITCGYDTPQLYREDALERIRQGERDCNESARNMNEIIRKGHLPEEPVKIPFPEAEEDDECE